MAHLPILPSIVYSAAAAAFHASLTLHLFTRVPDNTNTMETLSFILRQTIHCKMSVMMED